MNKKDFWLILVGLMLGVGGLMRENYGFTFNAGAEGVGANFAAVLCYLWGAWAVYKMVKIYFLSRNKPAPNKVLNNNATLLKEKIIYRPKKFHVALFVFFFLSTIGTALCVINLKNTDRFEDKNPIAYRQCVIDAMNRLKENNEEKEAEQFNAIKHRDSTGRSRVLFSLAEYYMLPTEFLKKAGITQDTWRNVILRKNGDCIMISRAYHTPADGSWSDFAITDVYKNQIIDAIISIKNTSNTDIQGLDSFSDTYKQLR